MAGTDIMYSDKFSSVFIPSDKKIPLSEFYHNPLKWLYNWVKWRKLRLKIAKRRLTEALEILENWGITGDGSLTVLSEMGGGSRA